MATPKPKNTPKIEPVMRLQALAEDQYELLIYGDIGDSWWSESVTAKGVVEQLNALPDSVATINVRINSYGGSVADGMAIYNALRRHQAQKAVTVDGVAMSSASLIAMAGDTRTMPETSLLMIHAPWLVAAGNAKDLRTYAEQLDTYSQAMTDAYVQASGLDRDAVLALLTDGNDHYYTGAEALIAGFATATGAADEEDDDAEPGAEARAFAAAVFSRIAARGVAPRYAALAAAASLRGPPRAAVAARDANPLPAPAASNPPADAGTTMKETLMITTAPDAKAILAADKQRREAIAAVFAPFAARADLDLGALQKRCEDDHDTTPEAAGQKLLAELGKDITPIAGGHRVETVRDETVTYRAGGIAAMLHRADPNAHKLDDNARQFRGMNLVDLARDALARAGMRTAGMARNEIAVKAMQSTSDFPYILENVITKTLRRGYEGTTRTFVPWCRQATLPDFKQVSRTQLSGAPNLKRVVEGAEYEFGALGDGAEKYSVLKYGRIVAVTWETIVNDDLDAITRIPFAFGASAGDLESDIVYGIVNGNPAMADTVALFHASHGNLGTAAALSASTDAPLAEMRQKMLLQKGMEGRYITVRPKFLIVPPELENAALKITNAVVLLNAAQAADVNVIGPTLTPIVEPRLHDGSATAWYAAADPATIDTIEYAYLEGNEGVFTETKSGFEVDGIKVKCRHVFGAKAIDYRGLFKNAGA